jgi:uncharacterized Tic20 family protein
VSDTPYQSPEPVLPELTDDARNWAMLCHLSALAGLVVPGVGMFVGPLVVWLLKRNEHPFIDDQGKEALNFQISMLIYIVISAAMICILIGIVLLPIVIVMNIVFVVIASIKASNGVVYRYPLTIRLIK